MKVDAVEPAVPGLGWDRVRAVLARMDLLLVVLLMMAVLSALQPQFFLTRENLTNVARQIASNAVLALGQLLVVATAGIDLSVGSVMGLCMTVLALATKAGWPALVSLGAAVALGAAVGAINGLALTRLHLPHPFIATLATLNVARGATYLLSGGVPISGLSPEVRWLGSADLTVFSGTALATAVPVSFLVVVALYAAVAVFLRRTPTGRHVYALGGNRRAAQYAGIDVSRLLVLVYVLCGALAGVAGVLLAGRVNSAYPTAGIGAELDSIAAVIIGGASFFGGRGTPGGVFLGAVIMGLLRNGLNLMNVSVFWQQVFIGIIILLAVYVDVLRRRAAQLES